MKNLAMFLIAFTMVLAISSCTKENNSPAPAPVVMKTVAELLTDSAWKLQEARFLQNSTGDFTYYSRGITNNGNLYDMDSIKFNADYSGVYTNSGGTSNFSWSLLDTQKTKLRIIFSVNNFTVTWENLNVQETSVRYSEYYTEPSSGLKSEGAFYRTTR